MSPENDGLLKPPSSAWWSADRGASPIVATAIHEGHHVRPEVEALMALTPEERLREEDPFTETFLRDVPNRIVFHRSRFEVDINRARHGAIYLRPEQAWGLSVWRERPAEAVTARSLAVQDAYYAMLETYLADIERQHGRFVVLDLHSYNHRRAGPTEPVSPFEAAPEINIGTASMDRRRWAPVVEAFRQAAAAFRFRGRPLDMRENVAFQGKGEQTRFIHARFPQTGCAIAVEFKKIFMDEWTGAPDPEAVTELRAMIASTLPALEAALKDVA